MVLNTVLSPPIPAYQNVPIQPQFYQPSQFIISAISLGIQTLITTTANVNYVIGQLIRLIIPPSFGTRGLNEAQSYVIGLPAANQVLLNVSSIGMDPFISSSATTKAQILAIGSSSLGAINSQGRINQQTFVPGSFINISPL